MPKSWITSWLVITSFTGWLIGTCRASISRWPSGCWTFHIHCLPMTLISIALLGAWACPMKMMAPQANITISRKNGTTAQLISIQMGACTICPVSSSLLRRYLIPNTTISTKINAVKKTVTAVR